MQLSKAPNTTKTNVYYLTFEQIVRAQLDFMISKQKELPVTRFYHEKKVESKERVQTLCYAKGSLQSGNLEW